MTDPGAFTAGGRPAIVVDLARAGFTDAVEVGRGGFGVVFRATQEALNRVVAVKLLHTDLDTTSRERFFREGRAMGGLSGHPNVVDVLQVGVTHSGRPYIVMPFQSLDSLAARVRREGPIDWEEATRLGVRLAGALESAHRVGTLHRDVKPANILLSDYGEAQLTDFGIARIEGGFETATGAFTGSLSYTAPEVLNGKPPTPRSDIYGLGAALFSIIAGRAAFERREGEEIIAQFLRITGQPIPDLRGHGVPDALCAVLEKAMAKDPTERPASAEDFGHKLQDVQREAGLPVAEMALPARKPPAAAPGGQGGVVVDERSPSRRSAGAWALDDRPMTSDRERSPNQYRPTQAPATQKPPTQAPAAQNPAAQNPATQFDPGQQRSTEYQGGRDQAIQDRPTQYHQGPPPDNRSTQAHPPPEGYVRIQQGRSTGSGETTAMMADRDGTMVLNGVDAAHGAVSRGHTAGGTPPPALPPPGPPADRPRRKGPLIAAVAAVVALLASLTVAGVMVWRGRETPVGPGAPPTVGVGQPASAWRALRDDPTPRQQVATTVADGVVWVIGGLTDAGAATTKVEGYDPAIDTWKSAIDLPLPLNHAMAVTYRGAIVVLGGWVAEGSNIKAVSSNKVFIQEGGGWKELPPMLSPHVAGGAVVIGDQIVVTGGQADDQLVATTEVFDGTAWRKVADLPTPREHLGMATDGTYAYVAGGRALSSDKNSSVLERFDPRTGTWTGLAPMPAPRGGVGAAYADGRVVVVGGEQPAGVDNSVFAYDTASNTWSSLPDLPQGRHGLAVAAVDKTIFALDGATQASHTSTTGAGQALLVPQRRLQPAPIWSVLPDAPIARQFSGATLAGGKMWVAGGLTQGDATKAVYAYDATIGRWIQGPDLPLALHHVSAVEWQGQLVVIGGWAPQDGNVSGLVSGKVFVLRGAGKWEELPPLRHPRVAQGAVTIGNKIIVFGGQANEKLVAETEVFDGTKWTDAAPIPTPREHLSAATDGTWAYAVGGRDLSSDKNSAVFERFDPATGAWHKLPDLPTPRGGVSATFIDGRIVAAGGEEPTRVLNTVEAYDIDTGRWTALPPLRVARHGIALVAIGNTVFAVGGAQRPTHQASAATVEALTFS